MNSPMNRLRSSKLRAFRTILGLMLSFILAFSGIIPSGMSFVNAQEGTTGSDGTLYIYNDNDNYTPVIIANKWGCVSFSEPLVDNVWDENHAAYIFTKENNSNWWT